MRTEQRETDLLIVGSGFAGLWAAIAAREAGIERVDIAERLEVETRTEPLPRCRPSTGSSWPAPRFPPRLI